MSAATTISPIQIHVFKHAVKNSKTIRDFVVVVDDGRDAAVVSRGRANIADFDVEWVL